MSTLLLPGWTSDMTPVGLTSWGNDCLYRDNPYHSEHGKRGCDGHLVVRIMGPRSIDPGAPWLYCSNATPEAHADGTHCAFALPVHESYEPWCLREARANACRRDSFTDWDGTRYTRLGSDIIAWSPRPGAAGSADYGMDVL